MWWAKGLDGSDAGLTALCSLSLSLSLRLCIDSKANWPVLKEVKCVSISLTHTDISLTTGL